MPEFAYRSVPPSGLAGRGRLHAPDRARAACHLQAQGHVLLALTPAEPGSSLRAFLNREVGGRRRLSGSATADFVDRLALLLEADVSVEAALGILAGSAASAAMRRQADALLRRLRSGASLAEAMSAEAGAFTAGVIAMVRAGEAGGSLAPTLKLLGDTLKRTESVRQSVRSALIYPVILVVTAIGTVVLILTVVLPELEPVIADAGAAPPAAARLAFAASFLVRQYWWLLLTVPALLVLAAHQAFKQPRFRLRRDSLLLRVPVLGQALRTAEAGRFARSLGALLGGGVPLSSALSLAHPVLANAVIAQAVLRVAEGVREGGALAGPLATTGVMPDLAVQLIRIGEATGRLPAMLLQLAGLCEADVRRSLDRALSLLVPLLTIGLGGLVAGIIAAVMSAVLSVNDMVR